MTVYLSLMSCVLLAAVAGLLMMVGFQVRQMRFALKDAPSLGDAVSQQLRVAREALQSLEKAAREESPLLEKRVREAQMASQDLTYLTQRAEEILQLLEKTLEENGPGLKTGVAGANVAAAREPTEPVANDPLENLLAGLAAARVEAAEVQPKTVSKKPTPPTAMEVLMGVAEVPTATETKTVNPLRVVADMQAKRREKSQAERDLQDAVMRRAG